MKIIVNCTTKHLEKAKFCGIEPKKYFHAKRKDTFSSEVVNNCWIAVALHDLFPFCTVGASNSQEPPETNDMGNITNYFISNRTRYELKMDSKPWDIRLPINACEEIANFDSSANAPYDENIKGGTKEAAQASVNFRLSVLKPFSFEIDIPEEILDIILECNNYNIDVVHEILDKVEHLVLVEK